MKKIYTKWIPEDKIILVDSNTSELSKLVSNAFLGQRISSINSITALCESTNSDINKLSITVGSDNRIGKNFLKASMGFGGSCLKKDILSLVYILSSRNLDLEAQYWSNVILLNEYQRLRICNIILKCFESLKSKIKTHEKKEFENEEMIDRKHIEDLKINIFGLSFKGNTNDVRGANSIFLVNFLLKNSVQLNLFDPHVKKVDFENELKFYNENIKDENLNNYLSFYSGESYFENIEKALNLSPINVFCTDHKEFKKINLNYHPNEQNRINGELDNQDKFIFDLYDVFNIEKLKESNFKIYKMGVINETEVN